MFHRRARFLGDPAKQLKLLMKVAKIAAITEPCSPSYCNSTRTVARVDKSQLPVVTFRYFCVHDALLLGCGTRARVPLQVLTAVQRQHLPGQ